MSSNETRIDLAPLALADAPFLLRLMNTAEYKRFVGDRGIDSLGKAENYIDQYFLASYRQHGFGYYVVRDRNNVSTGMVGLMQRDYLDRPDLGFAFLPEYFGRGIAREACESLLQMASVEYGLNHIKAFTSEDNIASQKLLIKLGFSFDGVMRHPDEGHEMQVYSSRSGCAQTKSV